MTINYNKDKERQHYIEINHLEDSHIDKKILYQYRNVLPQRKYVGRTNNEYKIFFEETRGSLVKRNYGKSDKVTSWTLLYSNGETSERMTKDFIDNNEIIYYNGYSQEKILEFLQHNSKQFNALDNEKIERKVHGITLSEEEFEMVQEFLKKVRGKK